VLSLSFLLWCDQKIDQTTVLSHLLTWFNAYTDCVCMNDNLDNSEAARIEIERLAKLFEERFPEPSSIENRYPKHLTAVL